ncbi:MAG: immune inhibitor A [Longispora sp.]|nr:immune inhibitor A [Longispora sp. (in: high G+C Gram-positive bacteria)]
MRKGTRVLVAGFATGLLTAGLTTVSVAAHASPDHPAAQPMSSQPPATEDGHLHRPDELTTPAMLRERADKKEALNLLIANPNILTRRGESTGIQLPSGRWVQWGTPKTAQIFTLLAEFGEKTPDGGQAGPARNTIPKPDRDWNGDKTDDNSTAWAPEYTQAYYQKMLFGKKNDSMTDFYLRQSSGRYTVDGEVTPWVKLPDNTSRYGKNDNEYDRYGAFVKDTLDAWHAQQKASGRTDAQIKKYLTKFDIWDRNDYDNDGNFDEPDGYLDHVQIIHSGEGEESGGGIHGDDAIWSHSWSAFSAAQSGPTTNKQGGVQIGDSGIWVGRYTTEPENGGLGVFCHEYGHDIGLPDYYDTNGGDNGTGFWTLMSGGSWLNNAKDNIGDRPGYMGPNEKLFLGWLDYDTVELSRKTSINALGPAAGGLGLKQATLVKLPTQKLTKEYTKPFAGQGQWWAGDDDNLDSQLTRSLDLTGATSASITAKVTLDTEEGYDFFRGMVSTDEGANWTVIGKDQSGKSEGWKDMSWDLSAYAGKKVQFRFQYITDGGMHFTGVFLDDIALTVDGKTVFTDDAESELDGWSVKGWLRFNGTLDYTKEHFYLVENRQYVGYDATLQKGPYNYGWADAKPSWVEHFAFNPGVVIWYVNSAYGDNNTSQHAGYGEALPIDARPGKIEWPNSGGTLANRRQGFDGAFGRRSVPSVTLHKNGVPLTIPASKGIAVFDDSDPNRYWSADNELNSVKVAGTGIRIEVVKDGFGLLSPAVIKITRK